MIESGPSIQARLLASCTRATLRNALEVGVHAAHLPWPYGVVDSLARLFPKSRGSKQVNVLLPNCSAVLIRARGVQHRTGRVVLYFHGGAFLTCGVNTHSDLVTRLSRFSNAPVLAVNYRMIPKWSVADAIEDCIDAYDWLRRFYEPGEIVLAGDSAGGYLALATATHLMEQPAGIAMLSPLLQLDPAGKRTHPNIRCDAMFGPGAFGALNMLVERAGFVYEPLDDLFPELPPTLIHVSGHEVLLHDARLAEERLTGLGVPVEVVVWPGQIHVFQIAPFVPEASRSLRQVGEFIIGRTSDQLPQRDRSERTVVS